MCENRLCVLLRHVGNILEVSSVFSVNIRLLVRCEKEMERIICGN